MAELLVVKNTPNWKKGDHIEAFGPRVDELVSSGLCIVLKSDPEPPVEEKPHKREEAKPYVSKN